MNSKRFKALSFGLAVAMATVASFGMFHMGWSYITQGYGLHPFLSIPGGIMAFILPFAVMYVFDEE